MKKPVVVLDYSVDALSGANISRWFDDPVSVARVEALEPFPFIDPGSCRAVIHSGSALSILDDHPFIEGAASFIRACASAGVPQMGICYGHQLLARVLCGRDAVERCETVELGWLPVDFFPSWPVPGPAGPLRVWQSHYDRVVKLPRGSKITASSSHTAIQAFICHEPALFGTQFHPEFDRESGNSCFAADPDIFLRNGVSLQETLQDGPDLDTGRTVFQHFLQAFEQES